MKVALSSLYYASSFSNRKVEDFSDKKGTRVEYSIGKKFWNITQTICLSLAGLFEPESGLIMSELMSSEYLLGSRYHQITITPKC